jgi:adenylate kinase
MLAGRLRVPHISIGSLLRSYARDKSEVGSRLSCTMASGDLAPDSLVLEVLGTRMSEPDCAKGLILDGFPRTLRQAEFLEGSLSTPLCSNSERGRLVALYLRVQHRTIVQRVSGRRICSRCGATYHLDSQPPRVKGECDVDGSPLTTREDDRRATVLKRLQLYEQQTVPILNHYAAKASLLEIDGEQSRETIAQEIATAIQGLLCMSDSRNVQSGLEDNALNGLNRG